MALLPVTAAGRAAAAGALLVALGAAVTAWRAASDLPVPERCRSGLTVVADDGLPLPVEQFHCEDGPGRAPALVVWTGDRTGAPALAAALVRWYEGGRTVWWVQREPREPTASALVAEDLPQRDLEAVVAALAAQPWVDPGRVGVLLAGDAVRLARREARYEVPAGAAALALLGASGPAGEGVLRLEAPDPAHAARWLAERLELPPAQETSAPGGTSPSTESSRTDPSGALAASSIP